MIKHLSFWNSNQHPKIYLILLTVSLVAALANVFIFISEYGVDLLIADRVLTWKPILNEQAWYQGFFDQHGPHRQGVMFLLTLISHWLFGWNTVGDFYIGATFLVLTLPLGITLRWKLTKRTHWIDILVPWLVLSITQWETFLINPHIHVMLPFFGLCFAHRLLAKPAVRALLPDIALIFLALFSTYAFFLLPGFIGIRLVQYWRYGIKAAIFLLPAISLILVFFYMWNFHLPERTISQNWSLIDPIMIGTGILGSFFGFSYFYHGLYLAALGLLTFLAVSSFRLFFGKLIYPEVFLMLTSGLALFVIFLSFGRSASATEGIYSVSRYFSFMSLGFWIIYTWGLDYLKPRPVVAQFVFGALIALGIWQPKSPKKNEAILYHRWASDFKSCISIHDDVHHCLAEAKGPFYFNPKLLRQGIKGLDQAKAKPAVH